MTDKKQVRLSQDTVSRNRAELESVDTRPFRDIRQTHQDFVDLYAKPVDKKR